MKLITIIAITFFLFPFSLRVYGQDKGPQGRIVLEEEEVTLFDENGNEIEKRYVSNIGEPKREMLKQVKMRVYAKLEIKSEQEVQSNKLWKKVKEETDKLLKVQVLKQARLRFTDKDGKEIKTIFLRNKLEMHKISSGTIQDNGALLIQDSQCADLSDSGNAVGVVGVAQESFDESVVTSTRTFEYINAKGESLWSVKNVNPSANAVTSCGSVLSKDGSRIALSVAQFPKEAGMMDYPNWVVVYNEKGIELVRFGPYNQLRNLYLSKNGRYGYFDIGKAQICFDVNNKILHEFPQERANRELNGVIRVSETGHCTINSYRGPLEFDEQGEQKTHVVREFSFKD